MKWLIKQLADCIIGIIKLICILGQLCLLYYIATFLLKQQDLCFLIIGYVVCEWVLSLLGEGSLTKSILSLINKDK